MQAAEAKIFNYSEDDWFTSGHKDVSTGAVLACKGNLRDGLLISVIRLQ